MLQHGEITKLLLHPPRSSPHLLLGHGHDRLLVHAGVVDAHPAEDGKRLQEVLVVLAERQLVELVDQLDHTHDLQGQRNAASTYRPLRISYKRR